MNRSIRKTAAALSALALSLSAAVPYGSVYAEEPVSKEPVTEEDEQAHGCLIGEQLSQYAAEHPDEYVTNTEDA